MTTRTLLVTLAASLAPLYAQQPAAPATTAQLFTELARPLPSKPTASPEQRAQLMGALALLPQDVSDFAVLTNVGGNLLRLAESGTFPELQVGDLPRELLALDNIALAGTAATPATYALLRHSLVSLSTLSSSMQLAETWAAEARRELADTIIEELLLRADAGMPQPQGASQGVHLPASYSIITCKPGGEGLLQYLYELQLREMRAETPEGVSLVEDAAGFTGIRIDVAKAFHTELEEATRNMAPRRREMLMQQLSQHPIHLLTRLQGNALITALCQDPQDLKLAASPAESLLATDKLAGCDARLGEGLIAAARISPELAAVCRAAHTEPSAHLAAGISAVFTRLAEQEPTNKEVYEKAAAGISFLSNAVQDLTRPVTQPSTLLIWCDGNLHLSATSDALGCSYRPGELRLAAMAEAPQTSLYAESTPMQTGLTPPESRALVDAAFATAEGFALTLAEDERRQANNTLSTIRAFVPELGSIAAAGSTICRGLNGHAALVMDSTLAPLPAVPGAQPGLQAEAPRFALYAGVSERNKLAEGWADLKASAAQLAVKLGAPAEIINLLPITTRQVGNAMSYSITLPFFTQDAVPSVAVTDTGLTLGSSVNLTTLVAESATGTTPFAGGAFALKFAPLAKTLRSLATALDHDAEEAIPAANSEVRLEKESGEAVLVNSPEGPALLCYRSRFTSPEDAADTLSTAAAVFEFASTVAEGLFGTSTVENGQHTLHVEVKMK